jgi:ribosomal protein L7/L12
MAETFDCPSCGAALVLSGSNPTLQCTYCGKTVIVPEELREKAGATVISFSSTHVQNIRSNFPSGPELSPETAQEILAALRKGNKIEAIKIYRNVTGLGLKESKDAIETAGQMLEAAGGMLNDELASILIQTAGSAQPAVTAEKNRKNKGLGFWLVLVVLGILLAVGLPILLLTGDPASGQGAAELDKAVAVPTEILVSTATDLPAPSPTPGFAEVLLASGSEGIGPGMFKDARSAAVDNQGHIYIGEYSGGRVQVFDSAGTYLAQWKVDPNMPLRGLTANRKGVVFGVQSGQISRYEGMTGKLLGNIVYSGGDWFDDAATTPQDGLAAVFSNNTDDVVLFDAGGKVVLTIHGAVSAQTGEPELDARVAVDGEGNIYVLGTFNHVVVKYSPDGKYINRWGSQGNDPGQIDSANAIAVDGQGRVYVSDFRGIEVFDSSGRYLATIDRSGIFGMVFDDHDHLFLAGRTQWYQLAIRGPQ